MHTQTYRFGDKNDFWEGTQPPPHASPRRLAPRPLFTEILNTPLADDDHKFNDDVDNNDKHLENYICVHNSSTRQ